MKNNELRRQLAWANAMRASRHHGMRSAQSKRTVKGRAKHVNVPLRHSRVYSINMEKIYSSPHTYKSMDHNVINCKGT